MIARLLILLALAIPLLSPSAEPLKRKVNFLDLIKSGQVTYHVNDKMAIHDAPDKIWSFQDDGMLKISGMGFGYVRSNESFRDYHLVIEYKFTGPTHGTRDGKARDNGLFVHCHGPDGSYGGTWMAGIEAQIIEGGEGDILVLSPKLEDGTELITSVTSEIGRDRDNEMIWKRGEPKQAVTKGRINWEKRDVDWKDEAGFRGRDDVASRLNEWTRMEVIAKGDTLQYFVNGVLVNECSGCKPSEGQVFLQTEGAEMLVKRLELYPLGEFKEKWDPVSASGGTDVPVKPSREAAWTPEQERAGIEIDGPYEVQLVAAEPLVRDPVEVTWDAQGRCFVADMIDYPLGAGPGKPPLSRIQQLIDDDKDGHYDRAVTFAEHMDHVQGLLPYQDGLIATTRTQILFIRDTDGDGVADERKPLVEGFNPNHSQLQVSAPRWGLDNCVYFNNGLDTKEIYPAGSPDKKESFARRNLRWDPVSGKLEPTTGFGQYGGCFDDWGRHFFCSNRNPVMFAVMPYEAVTRNPHAGITQGWEDIAPSGAEAKIHPLAITHTTADAHAGTHTAACGLGVYRGDLMPELRGEIFTCEPTAQAVIRYHPEPNGASLKATRVGDHTEFFRSHDEWTRPVNITTGPDGALYVCDIYRQYIDHARFFPEDFAKTHNMRAGENEGRIWRIVPKGTKKLRAIEPAPKTTNELVAWLGHKNSWQRETAQRLLVQKADKKVIPLVADVVQKSADSHARVHALGVLFSFDKATTTAELQKGLKESALEGAEKIPGASRLVPPSGKTWWDKEFYGAMCADPLLWECVQRFWLREGEMKSQRLPHSVSWSTQFGSKDARERLFALYTWGQYSSDGGTKFFVKAVLPDPDDVWIQRAVLSASQNQSGGVLAGLVGQASFTGTLTQPKADFVRSLASCAAADANPGDFGAALSALDKDKGKLLWWKPALLQGLSDGLPKSGGKLGVKSLAALTANPPGAYKDAAAEITALLAQVDKIMADPSAPMEQRLACIPLLSQRTWDKAEPVMRALLADTQPIEISTAALAALKKFPADKTATLIYELLPKLGPSQRADVVKTLASSSKTVKDFFERIDRGEVPKAFVDAETRWRYLRPNNPLYPLAEKIFGKPSTDRAAVIANYADAVKRKGDSAKGHQIFSTICIACHRLKGEGVDVAPDITDVRIKEKEALLSDILDPNRMVEARWMAYQIDTKDGRMVAGIVSGESSTEVTVKMAGGLTESIQRSNITSMKCLDASLMPVGLEAGITKDQMADLLAFLKGE